MLHGGRPCAGRPPVTWPKSEVRLPVDAGDTAYDPQIPNGWGLTTEASTGERADATPGAAHAPVTEARLRVQEKVGQGVRVTEAVAKPFGEAEHLLLTGRYAQASAKGEAYRAA